MRHKHCIIISRPALVQITDWQPLTTAKNEYSQTAVCRRSH